MTTKVKLYRSLGVWRWRIADSNGAVIAASSEGYSKRAMALRNLNRVTRILKKHQVFSLPAKSRNGSFSYVLK